jgi:glucose/arabinose dehydrogenase
MKVLLLCYLFLSVTAHAAKSRFEEILKGDDVVWGMDFLPDGRLLYSERGGKLFALDLATKKRVEIKGLPKVYAMGQGGLLDVRVHPQHKTNRLVFFSYAEPVGEDESTTAVMRAELVGQELKNGKKIFEGAAANDNDIHYGSRIVFGDKGDLFVTMGDRDEREKAQDLSRHQGKILHLKEDGTAASDNPFIGREGARTEIWSLGHRSPQGLDRHPVTGDLWEVEMGPRGGDELNFIKRGANYGWPLATYGREYWGPRIGQETRAGTVLPVAHWVPSISPSAAHFYTGDKYPGWKHHLFLATMSGNHLRRLQLEGERVTQQEVLLEDLEYRWRCLRTGPDGFLYLGTDEGRIGRLVLE